MKILSAPRVGLQSTGASTHGTRSYYLQVEDGPDAPLSDAVWSESDPGRRSTPLGAEASGCCNNQAGHEKDRAEEDNQGRSDCPVTRVQEEGRIEAGTVHDGAGKRVTATLKEVKASRHVLMEGLPAEMLREVPNGLSMARLTICLVNNLSPLANPVAMKMLPLSPQ